MTLLYFRFRTIISKSQWISSKLDMCIDIVEIWFQIANGQIFCPQHENGRALLFHVFTAFIFNASTSDINCCSVYIWMDRYK